MPNPRFIGDNGEPTVELLLKLEKAKRVYFQNLESFCNNNSFSVNEMKDIRGVYLIGSHAKACDWDNENSDVNFKLVLPFALPMNLFEYKRKVLDPILCHKHLKKSKWIDLFFVREEYQVFPPHIDLTEYWHRL